MAFYSAMAVADFIIDFCSRKKEPVSNLRLQKLLYFTWVRFYEKTNRNLFYDPMYAWQLGPVVPEVYNNFCSYGGRPINQIWDGTEIEQDDAEILGNIIMQYWNVPSSELVERTHKPDTAWYQVYDGGKGNRKVIPFELIKMKEFGEGYVS